MGYSNGQLETSSGTGGGEKGEPGLPGIGFNLTDDGNFDLDSKRLTDVADPVDDGDAATKKYVDDENVRQDIAINSKAEGDRVLPLDGSKSMTGNIQMGSKKITDLSDGSDNGDAVNYSQLLSHTDNHQVNYHLQPSFTFYKDQTIINPKNDNQNNIPNHNHLDLYIFSKTSSNKGFGGQAWVSLRVTNTLKAGLYTVVFETFSSIPGFPPLNDETLITQVFGDAHFKIITFNHDWESDSGGNTPHSKAHIQFSSDGQSGEITFEIRYYGSSYNQNIKFLFFSRVISGKHDNTFNHALFDVNSVQSRNQIMYFEDINLNQNRIIKLQDPIDDNDAATKGYIDQKVENVDLTGYLKRDGSLNMTGNLQMNKKYIEDLETPNDVSITDLVNYQKDAYRAANKEYLRQNFLKKDENGGNDYDLRQVIRNAEPYRDGLFGDNDLVSKAFVDAEIAKLPKNVLKLDGSQAMRGNLQMGDHTITGIRSSSGDDAALTNGGAKSLYLPLSGNKGMQGILNMSNNAIRYLKMPPNDPSSGNPPDDCALNFKYFHSQRGDLERQINEVGSKALSLDGSDPMGGNLDMNGNNIIRLKDPLPSNSQYAASVNFVNKTISDSNANLSKIIDRKITEVEKFNIKNSTQNNAFLFVMEDDLFREDDDDITKVGEVDKDFYQIKKATYQFTIKYDSSIKYYSTRLSIDLISLPLGEYTLVFEMYYSGKTDKNQVTVNATSGSLTVSRTNTNTFGDHSRSIINFHKYIFSSGYEDLDIDIALKNKAGESYDPNTTIYVVVYGVIGHQNEVSTLVWDSAFALENKALKLKANIDMNEHDIINVDKLSFKSTLDMGGKEIKNVGDGIENGDAANIKQLNEFENNLVTFINRKITGVDKNLDAQKVELIKDLNDAICDYSFSNWKVCEFYVTDGNDYDGSLRDRKPGAPFLKLEQSDTNKKPVVVANGHAGNAYFSFNQGECIITSTTENILVSLLSILYMIILQLSMVFGEMRMEVMIGILLFIIQEELKNYF